MSAKIFRDPLYNYIGVERDKDQWLLELIDTPEVQRLRRIHQLGVSHYTYPGADHSRFSHSLGVVHLMQEALRHVEANHLSDAQVRRAREPLLAAALLHDVGHGPFSHLFEPCLGIDHEDWSVKIINSEESAVNEVLRRNDISPESVTSLIGEGHEPRSAWKKSLLSSQLDVDRLDYLRRDSLFTGAGYGHYDFFRLLHSFTLVETSEGYRDLVWTEKAVYAIEEYIFARFYMYNNVYMHKTTRGYEKLLQKMWERAKSLRDDGTDVHLVRAIADFWAAEPNATVSQYLALEEHAVLSQIDAWAGHSDRALSDLAGRFLNRRGFVAIDAPASANIADEVSLVEWEAALREAIGEHIEYQPADAYVLRDDLKTKIYSTAYSPARSTDENSAINSIRILRQGDENPIEISQLLRRLEPVTDKPEERIRYYVPRECRSAANKLRAEWRPT